MRVIDQSAARFMLGPAPPRYLTSSVHDRGERRVKTPISGGLVRGHGLADAGSSDFPPKLDSDDGAQEDRYKKIL